jgi:hypothetical protein
MKEILFWYALVGAIVWAFDAITIYDKFHFNASRALLFGLVDGIIWPIRIGWDIIAYAIYCIKQFRK